MDEPQWKFFCSIRSPEMVSPIQPLPGLDKHDQCRRAEPLAGGHEGPEPPVSAGDGASILVHCGEGRCLHQSSASAEVSRIPFALFPLLVFYFLLDMVVEPPLLLLIAIARAKSPKIRLKYLWGSGGTPKPPMRSATEVVFSQHTITYVTDKRMALLSERKRSRRNWSPTIRPFENREMQATFTLPKVHGRQLPASSRIGVMKKGDFGKHPPGNKERSYQSTELKRRCCKLTI